MKNTIRVVVLFLLICLALIADANPTYTVRTVYFQPTDAPNPTDRIADIMSEVQALYQNEMERYGYGAKTFRLETDNAGDAIVQTVKGSQNTAYYAASVSTWDRISTEMPAYIQHENNISIIIVGGSRTVNNAFCGLGWDFVGLGISRGFVLVPGVGDCLNTSVIAHELGHAFGLRHNYESDVYLMGAGYDQLSECEARWLDKHHYFNDTQQLN